MTLCDFIYELTEHLHAVDRSQLVCIITLSLLLAVRCGCACMCACVRVEGESGGIVLFFHLHFIMLSDIHVW